MFPRWFSPKTVRTQFHMFSQNEQRAQFAVWLSRLSAVSFRTGEQSATGRSCRLSQRVCGALLLTVVGLANAQLGASTGRAALLNSEF